MGPFDASSPTLGANSAADESRWIRSPSSAVFIHEKRGAKQVVLNALVKLTFILYFFIDRVLEAGPLKTIYPKVNSQYHQP